MFIVVLLTDDTEIPRIVTGQIMMFNHYECFRI